MSDEIEVIKQSSYEVIQQLKLRLEEEEQRNSNLERRLRGMEELLLQKESRVVEISMIPPPSRWSLSQKKSSKSRVRDDSNFSAMHFSFLKQLVNNLMSRIFQSQTQVQHLLASQAEEIKELNDRLKQYKIQYEVMGEFSPELSLRSRGELFEVIAQHQQVILGLKSHISKLELMVSQGRHYQHIPPIEQYISTLIHQLRTVMGIITRCVKNKSTATKSTEARLMRPKEPETPPREYRAKMQSLLLRERYLTNQNRQLKNIVQGLIAHIKK